MTKLIVGARDIPLWASANNERVWRIVSRNNPSERASVEDGPLRDGSNESRIQGVLRCQTPQVDGHASSAIHQLVTRLLFIIDTKKVVRYRGNR